VRNWRVFANPVTYASVVHHYNYIILKIGNLKKKNRDHKQVAKQDENTGNLQIL